MITKEQLIKVNEITWEIPKELRKDMRIPARIYATEEMIEYVNKDKSLQQLTNVATLPGMQKFAAVMPDVHEGYGFPIGAVAAADYDDGVISPGGIGYDINCGVRLIKTNFKVNEIRSVIPKLTEELYRAIPSGVGRGGLFKLSNNEMKEVLNNGCEWAEKQGYTEPGDLDYIESRGSLKMADANAVSKTAIERGRDQLGTMGSGNHFIEINVVDEIFDEEIAKIYGLSKSQIVIQIHTGSRGLGHQVATDYVKQLLNATSKYNLRLVDRELSCAPIHSPEGRQYFSAMCASANFAWANRQMITYLLRKTWKKFFGSQHKEQLKILYDVAHNIAKIEEHIIDGEKKKVLVHRKGATRAFPANHPEVPEEFRSVGQPVLIPGSMGTESYVLCGLPASMELSFGSSCHGAGRLLSRTAALKQVRGDELKAKLNKMGIDVQTGSLRGLAEEAPDAYKDVTSVVEVVDNAQIAKKIARLKPLAVIKG